MLCFEVTLPGYGPESSVKDHLVKWVVASSVDSVRAWLVSVGLGECPLREVGRGSGYDFDWEDGVDVKLNAAGALWNPMYPASIETWEEEIRGTETYCNHYKCDCGCEWENESDCTCNDKCPECNTEIEPHLSTVV